MDWSWMLGIGIGVVVGFALAALLYGGDGV
jgi:hypothetical protein